MHASNYAPRSRVLHRRRRRTRRRRNTAPARRARFHPSVAPSRTYERTTTNASGTRAFDSRNDSRRRIEPRRRGHDVSSGAHGVDAREREKKKGPSRSRGRSRVRSVARVDDASARAHSFIHSFIRARASSRVSVWYRTYMGV